MMLMWIVCLSRASPNCSNAREHFSEARDQEVSHTGCSHVADVRTLAHANLNESRGRGDSLVGSKENRAAVVLVLGSSSPVIKGVSREPTEDFVTSDENISNNNLGTPFLATDLSFIGGYILVSVLVMMKLPTAIANPWRFSIPILWYRKLLLKSGWMASVSLLLVEPYKEVSR